MKKLLPFFICLSASASLAETHVAVYTHNSTLGSKSYVHGHIHSGVAAIRQIAPEAPPKENLLASHVIPPGQGTVRATANGGQSRDILRASLATGEAVSIHESIQMPRATPNPAHRIQHSEFILVREGILAFEHDGMAEEAGPGSIIYVAFGTLHTVRNIGTTIARYTVLAIGGDQKR